MRAFEYRAATPSGELIQGTTLASSEHDLDAQLATQGLVLTTAKAVPSHRRNRLRLKQDELLNLTNQLATVTSAGVPIVEGLRGIGERMSSEGGRDLVRGIVMALESGENLSSVISQYPRCFPPVYRASVQAGEESGALDKVLQRLAKHLEWVRGIRATAAQALVYPAILCTAIGGLILILLYFVLPRIIGMFPGGQEDLPGPTRFVIGVSDLLREHWLLVLGMLIAAPAALIFTARRPKGRRMLDLLLLKIPRLGAVASQIATSKFACTAGILQSSGCDVFTMLDVAAKTCGNEALATALRRATKRVRRGEQLSHALAREPLVDPLLVQMVDVGEKTGRLDECLGKLVEHYDSEVPRGVKRFLSLLEPALIVAAGVVVAFILLSALLPIFDLFGNLG